jgi:hypothetical protein
MRSLRCWSFGLFNDTKKAVYVNVNLNLSHLVMVSEQRVGFGVPPTASTGTLRCLARKGRLG